MSSSRIFSSVVAIIGLMVVLSLRSGAVASQVPAARADVSDSRAAAQTAAIPRTQDGKPNLSGFWRRTSNSNNIEEQPAAPFTPAQKTLITDPPDGRIPYQPWALEQRKINFEKYIDANGLCFSSGAPRTAYISPVNRIIQTPGYILHLLEEAHQYRIIYTDGRPYVGADIRLWQGDSRGRWEGDTLVVDVRNQNAMTQLDLAGNFYTVNTRVIERYTMVDANTIRYQATLEDADVYTRPWTLATSLTREKQQPFEMLEEACWEGERDFQHLRSIGFGMFPGVSVKKP